MSTEPPASVLEGIAESVFACVTERGGELTLADDTDERIRDILLAVPLDVIEYAIEEVLAVAHFFDAQKSASAVARGLVVAVERFIRFVIRQSGDHSADTRNALERSRRHIKSLLGRPTASHRKRSTLAAPSPSSRTGLGAARHTI